MDKKYLDYREESKRRYRTSGNSQTMGGEPLLDSEQLRTGALLRMADATEKMAGNYTKLQNDLDWYKEMYTNKCKQVERLEKRIAALRGWNNRYKKMLGK